MRARDPSWPVLLAACVAFGVVPARAAEAPAHVLRPVRGDVVTTGGAWVKYPEPAPRAEMSRKRASRCRNRHTARSRACAAVRTGTKAVGDRPVTP